VLALRDGLSYERALAVANAVGADAVGDASSQPTLTPLAHYQGYEDIDLNVDLDEAVGEAVEEELSED
jgi:hypothetical protein